MASVCDCMIRMPLAGGVHIRQMGRPGLAEKGGACWRRAKPRLYPVVGGRGGSNRPSGRQAAPARLTHQQLLTAVPDSTIILRHISGFVWIRLKSALDAHFGATRKAWFLTCQSPGFQAVRHTKGAL